jgi:hypothetical protein
VIISVFVRTECSFGGKVNVVGGDNIGIARNEFSYEQESYLPAGFWREV